MSTASKLWFGFGLLFLLLTATGLLVSHRLQTIEKALNTIVAVREPASAAAYEMEVDLLDTAAAVRDYVRTNEAVHKVRVAAGYADFDRLKIQYDRQVRSPASRALSQRIDAAYRAFRAMGDTLMDLSDRHRTLATSFEVSTQALHAILEDNLEGIDGRGRDGDRKLFELGLMTADVGQITSAAPAGLRARITERANSFEQALARFRGLRLSEDEQRRAAAIGERFRDFVAHARALIGVEGALSRYQARFSRMRTHVQGLIDQGVQALARTDLLLAQRSAIRAIQTSMLAVLILLLAGIAIGSATLVPTARSIVRTERRLREQREQLEASHRRKDEFLGVLSHELRNPLAPLSNALHVLEARGREVPEDVRRAHAMMGRQVHHIARLVDELLDLSRVNEGKIVLRREPTDLAAVVSEAIESLTPQIRQRGHQLTTRMPEKGVWVDADPVRLGQIVTNQLSNAVKYTPDGGRVEVLIELTGGEAVLAVRDNGVGIPHEMLTRVFEPFTQVDSSAARQHGGLGIGLALVRRLVELHRGAVTAESRGTGRGSTFTVRIPALQDAPRREDRPPIPSPDLSAPRPRRILVVDDSEDSAESLGELLRLYGHEVRVVGDGPAALDAAATVAPEIVLLDIGLPGMDGYQVARKLRQQFPGDPMILVALTGFGRSEDRRRADQAGFDGHLTKPVNPEALRALVSRV